MWCSHPRHVTSRELQPQCAGAANAPKLEVCVWGLRLAAGQLHRAFCASNPRKWLPQGLGRKTTTPTRGLGIYLTGKRDKAWRPQPPVGRRQGGA